MFSSPATRIAATALPHLSLTGSASQVFRREFAKPVVADAKGGKTKAEKRGTAPADQYQGQVLTELQEEQKLFKGAKARPEKKVIDLIQQLTKESQSWVVDDRTMEDLRAERRLREKYARYQYRRNDRVNKELVVLHAMKWKAINNLPPHLRATATLEMEDTIPSAYRRPTDTPAHPPGVIWK
eukprot:gb/GEZN01018189.1/.p1 GENE.gb/GEZN01018189.1/~~gb/GEZN01018189.1/.p1  ORF type:complete len:183 (-),score=36.93 gb/GEZN01018189.1/:71-619(-)